MRCILAQLAPREASRLPTPPTPRQAEGLDWQVWTSSGGFAAARARGTTRAWPCHRASRWATPHHRLGVNLRPGSGSSPPPALATGRSRDANAVPRNGVFGAERIMRERAVSARRARPWPHARCCSPPPPRLSGSRHWAARVNAARRDRGGTSTSCAARASRPPSPAAAGGRRAPGGPLACVCRQRRVAMAASGRARAVPPSRRDRPPQPLLAEGARSAAHVCAASGRRLPFPFRPRRLGRPRAPPGPLPGTRHAGRTRPQPGPTAPCP
jgi:hypothetical protein